MNFLAEYREARHDEDVARLRRVLALRAMAASGMSRREIAAALGVSQPAVSQQLKAAQDLARVHPEVLVEAAAPVLRRLAEESGYARLWCADGVVVKSDWCGAQSFRPQMAGSSSTRPWR